MNQEAINDKSMPEKRAVNGLKPCPFCASDARIRIDSGYIYYVECSNLACVCRNTRWFKTVDAAIKAWNTRTPPEKE